jgi:hypothetical protein
MSKWDRLLQSGPALLMSPSSLLWHSALVITGMAVIPPVKVQAQVQVGPSPLSQLRATDSAPLAGPIAALTRARRLRCALRVPASLSGGAAAAVLQTGSAGDPAGPGPTSLQAHCCAGAWALLC